MKRVSREKDKVQSIQDIDNLHKVWDFEKIRIKRVLFQMNNYKNLHQKMIQRIDNFFKNSDFNRTEDTEKKVIFFTYKILNSEIKLAFTNYSVNKYIPKEFQTF